MSWIKWIKKYGFYFWVTLPLLILLIAFTPSICQISDRQCWIDWAIFQHKYGISNTYRSYTDYLPLYHYFLNFYAHLEGNVKDIELDINRLKYLTVAFELLSSFVLYWVLNKKFKDQYKSLFYSLFYFLNVAVLYNSYMWGQVDGIMTFFVFASIILAFYDKTIFALLLFVLAVNMKLQAIFFFPILAYIIAIKTNKSTWKQLFIAIGLSVILQILIIAPFVYNGDFDKLMLVIQNSKGKYPVVSMAAYNVWSLLLDGDLMGTKDSIKSFGLSYGQWGLLMFFATSTLALLIPFRNVILWIFKKQKLVLSLNEILLLGAIIPLIFFFFNTQMHERYSHPALIFVAAYALLNKRIFYLVLVSAAYFLNLEDAIKVLHFKKYGTLIFDDKFIASLYLLTIVLLFVDLLKLQIKSLKTPKEPAHAL